MSPASRTPGRARRAHPGTPSLEAARERERELLLAIRRHGQLTVTGVALETSLSVDQAERVLSELAGKGHLEVRVEHGRLFYSLWESCG
jgi:predicted transcriptional regulator of viral defense system